MHNKSVTLTCEIVMKIRTVQKERPRIKIKGYTFKLKIGTGIRNFMKNSKTKIPNLKNQDLFYKKLWIIYNQSFIDFNFCSKAKS